MLVSISGASPAPIAELDLSPVAQQVSGSIEARFTMTTPDLAAVLGTTGVDEMGSD